MDKKNIKKLIKEIVDPEDHLELEVSICGNTFEAEFSTMYDRPKITFDKLENISNTFGTKLINLSDGRSDHGCESCDYGSSYGVIISVENPTTNI